MRNPILQKCLNSTTSHQSFFLCGLQRENLVIQIWFRCGIIFFKIVVKCYDACHPFYVFMGRGWNGSLKKTLKQECIPVGCVPAAHWPYAGGVSLLGVSLLGGVLPAMGVLPARGSPCQGVSLPGGLPAGGSPCQGGSPCWGVSLPGGFSHPGGLLLARGSLCQGVSLPGGLLAGGILVTVTDRCYYLNQAYLSMFIAGLKRGKTNRSQTATDVAMVIKLSLGSWSHMWSLSNVSGCGSTSLFGSRAGTHQGKWSVSRFGR